MTQGNGDLVYIPVGIQCFDLLDQILFQALVGPLQEESFGDGLLQAFPHKNRDSCFPKADNASQHLGSLVYALVSSLAPVVFKGGGVVKSQHSVHVLI